MGDGWAFLVALVPFTTPSSLLALMALPLVIQDAVRDEELTQKVPDVSVGPVL